MNFYNDIFKPAQRAVARRRAWYNRELHAAPLHPVIAETLTAYKPRDWHMLLLEHPHRSDTDHARIAYTRDERSGEADRQVVTTLGKYLTRHFDVPDHVIRDLVALDASTADRFVLLSTVDAMVNAVQNGPVSCMCWTARDFVRCADGISRHPYAVYDPAYGWHMAVRMSGDEIVGRALLNTDGDDKYFVRTYKKDPNGGYSHADERLEAWLKSQDYEKRNAWHNGARLALHELRNNNNNVLAPYMDGDVNLVYEDGGALVVSEYEGEYACDNTCGSTERRGRCTCEVCGDRVSDDDMTSVGYHEDMQVCRSCIENDYVYAYGRRGHQYFVHQNDSVYVDSQSEYYHDEYLNDNSIVCLANGDYEHTDNAVMCADDREWYHAEDDDIVYCGYDSEYHHMDNCVNTEDEGYVYKDDAWQCEGSSNWYSDNTDYVELDGERYHPDHAPEAETETNEE